MESTLGHHLSSIELLPPEVIEIIAGTLTVRDLAACCAVSRRLRDVFGTNVLWQRQCKEELAEYLRTTPCKVEPPFVSPETEDSTLSPVCYWRMAFMRENYLWNNWRQGRYKREQLKEQQLGGFRICPITERFATNDIALSVSCDTLELINLKNTPMEEAIQPILLPASAAFGWAIKVADDKVIAIYSSNVQVYSLDFTRRTSSLKHTFFCEDQEKLNIREVSNLKREFETRKNVLPLFRGFRIVGFRIVEGKFFVGGVFSGTTIHIWDLEEGIKLKEERCPTLSVTSSVISSGSSNIIMSFRSSEADSTVFLAYSLTHLTYFPFRQELEGLHLCVAHKEYIAVYNTEALKVFNYVTQTLIIDCILNNSHHLRNPPRPHFLGGNLLFVTDNILKLLNTVTRRVQPVLNGVEWFTVLSNKFIQVKKHGDHEIYEICSDYGSDMRVQELKPLRKTATYLHKHDSESCLNPSSTRYYLREEVMGVIFNFY